MEKKTCTRCKKRKMLDQFHKCARAKDGLNWECKRCSADRALERYHGDKKEELQAAHKQWLKDNKERVTEYARKYNAGEKGSGRGAYERILNSGLTRDQFKTQEEFADALNKFQNASQVAKARAYVNALKENPCTDCGRIFDPVCMDFDHCRGKKDGEVGKMVGKGWSLKRIQAEVDKCDLVCACCHRLRTKRRNEERRVALWAG